MEQETVLDFTLPAGVDQPFRIVENQVYAKLEGNEALVPQPSVVHFGGYKLNRVHVQKVSVLNTSDLSQRLHVINTTTPFFRVRYNKKGRVAPGMSEDIFIEFKPNAWRYYYDCIRLHCEGENLLIPIHAYPVLNDVVFPRVLDFGTRALCETARKTVEIKCSVPIQFEYELTVTKPHPDFSVQPMRGIIPANGAAVVEIIYIPVKLGTASMELKIDVSQFNFEPILCQISGNAAPGITRNRILAQINEANRTALINAREAEKQKRRDGERSEVPEVQEAIDETLKLSRRAFAEGLSLETYDSKVDIPWHGIGSGAVMDAGGAYLQAKTRKAFRERTAREAAAEESSLLTEGGMGIKKRVEEDVDIINGLRVPKDLTNTTAVNYLLTQEVGKLKPGDLKQAIAEQRAAREKRRLEQDALKSGSANDAGSADTIIAEEVAALKAGRGKRQLKEMVFLQGLRDISEAEINREFQTQRQHVGSPLLAKRDLERIALARKESARARAIIARSEDRERYRSQRLSHNLEGEFRGRATCASFSIYMPSFKPKFDVYNNDLWAMRRHALQRFQNAANTVIVRLRCGQRLALIKRMLYQALGDSPTRKSVKELVERDNRLAAAGVILAKQLNEKAEAESSVDKSNDSGATGAGELNVNSNASRTGGAVGSSMSAAPSATSLPRVDLPCYTKISGGKGGGSGGGSDTMRDPVDVEIPSGFDHLRPASLRLPAEAGLYNHLPMALPAIRMYAPIEQGKREFRSGAEEEESVRVKAKIPKSLIEEAAATNSNNNGDELADKGKDDSSKAQESAEEKSISDSASSSPRKSSCMALPAGASTWMDPCPASRTELLQPNASVRSFVPLEKYTEADPEFYLRPKTLVFDAPKSRHRKIIHGVGTSSLGALEGLPTLGNMFQETLQRPFEAWSQHRDHKPMWSMASVPKWLQGPEEEDAMSDTDSDEEVDPEADQAMLEGWPTIEESKMAFLPSDTEDNKDKISSDGENVKDGLDDSGDKDKIVSADIMLPRDITMALLSQRRAMARKPRWDDIPDFVQKVDEAIQYPKSKLTF